jgi:tryptophan 2,3-dioxygenase
MHNTPKASGKETMPPMMKCYSSSSTRPSNFGSNRYFLNWIMSRTVFAKEKINDNSEDMNLVLHRLKRVKKIIELCNHQVTVLDTMTPLDFLEFRNLLTRHPVFKVFSSGSYEARLGLEMSNRHRSDYYKRVNQGGFNAHDLEQINRQKVSPL